MKTAAAETLATRIIKTPFGKILLTANSKSLIAVDFIEKDFTCETEKNKAAEKILDRAAKQLDEYFAQKRKTFDLPLDFAQGTEFQQAVWRELCKIPCGKTKTYGEIAKAIGKPKASRAVGSACHNNPICIIVPCHRVVGSDNSLTGYAGGLDLKEKLLRFEKAI